MGEERKLYAAKLCYDQIGRRIRVTSWGGSETRGKLQAVFHNASETILIVGPFFDEASTVRPAHIEILADPKSIATVLY